MSLDFETRLRHDLLESTGPADDVALGIDAAIAVGQRTRRRRNLGWGAALGVVTLVAGASLASTVNGGGSMVQESWLAPFRPCQHRPCPPSPSRWTVGAPPPVPGRTTIRAPSRWR